MSPQSTRELSQLVGARRIRLLGRGDVLKNIRKTIRQAVKTASPQVIYLQGEGGIGKTYLLEELRRTLSTDQTYWVAGKIVDLYHSDYQTPYGLAKALTTALPSQAQDSFKEFRKKQEERKQALQRHDTQAAEQLTTEALYAWLDGLKKAAAKRPVVLVLDTLEQFSLQTGEDTAADWLRRVIRNLQGRVILLAAGRPQDQWGNANTFAAFLQKEKEAGRRIAIFALEPLQARHCQEYLEAVAESLPETNSVEKARIRAFLKRRPDDAYALTRGQPLRLALLADILRVTGQAPKAAIEEKALDKILIEHLTDTEYPVSEALFWLARLPKGANATLLSQLMGKSQAQAQDLLDDLANLSIVKYRGSGFARPYFLHDEIYRLFRRYVPLSDDAASRWFEVVEKYYTGEIADRETKLSQRELLAYDLIVNKRYALRAEFLYYLARHDPEPGFSRYYIWHGDAIESRSSTYHQILFYEIRRALGDRTQEQGIPDNVQAWVNDDAQIAPLEYRLIALGEDIKETLEACALQTPFYQEVHRPLLQGILAIKANELQTADAILFRAEKALEAQKETLPGETYLYARAMLANYRGLIARRRDLIYPAMRHYQVAVAGLLALKTDNQSGVLINLAYAEKLAEHNRAAYSHIRAAYPLAKKSGNPYELARVYSVHATLLTLDTNYPEAEEKAQQALVLLEKRPNKVLEGRVRLKLGRLWRYRWNPAAEEGRVEAWKDYLPTALTYVAPQKDRERLADILKQPLELSTPAALDLLAGNLVAWVEVQNEIGSIWREIAWAYRKEKGELCQRAQDSAENYLLQAAGIDPNLRAKITAWEDPLSQRIKALNSPYWPLWALVNLGWHYYYQKPPYKKRTQEDVVQLEEKIRRLVYLIRSHIPPAYLFKALSGEYKNSPAIDKEASNLMLWKVLAKLEMLQARTHLLTWKGAPPWDDDLLRNVVHHWIRSLAYNEMIGDNSYDYHRAETNIENRILDTPNWERALMPRLYRLAREAEEAYYFSKGKRPPFTRFLEDRYGPAELWGV